MHRWILALIASFWFPASLSAQAEAEPATSVAESESDQDKPKEAADATLRLLLTSPQACFDVFTHAVQEGNWKRATECLDFTGQNQEVRINRGEMLAYRLDRVLQAAGIIADQITEDDEYEGPYGLVQHAQDPATGEPLDGARHINFSTIAIEKSADGLWRFAPGTVTQIDAIFEQWETDVLEPEEDVAKAPWTVWLRNQFPEKLRERHFLIEDFKWICLAAVVALGFLADAIVGFLALHVFKPWMRISDDEKEQAFRRLWKPVGLLVQATVWYYGTRVVDLPIWTSYLSVGLRFFAVFAGIWVVFRVIDLGSAFLSKRAERTKSKFDDLLVPLVSKSLKLVVLILGVLMCAETFHLPIKGLLGGLGLGGMALALASRDAVSNLFGSFTVLVDRPFEIGDWVITENIEGTVEQVGFRSTRIRTFYNSLITLPNSRLTTAVVDNMGRRRYRRVKATLGLEYNTTPEQMDAFCEGVRELIRRHPNTRKDYFHVYFNGFNDCSLDVLLYFFLRVPDWSSELREKHNIFADILRLAQDLNVGFAFPTRTLHMISESESPLGQSIPADAAVDLGRETARRIVE